MPRRSLLYLQALGPVTQARLASGNGWLIAIPEDQLSSFSRFTITLRNRSRAQQLPLAGRAPLGEMMMPARKAAFFMAMLASMLLAMARKMTSCTFIARSIAAFE